MPTRWYVAVLTGVFLAAVGRVGTAQEAVTAEDIQASNGEASERYDFSPEELERILRGFEIAPVRLNLQGKNVALVGLGSYIVNAQGGCNDCHTFPSYREGRNPFLGEPERINSARYLAGGTPFGPPNDPNTPVSRNLTPRASGRPAGLTWPQFRRTLRTGVDLKHRPPFVPSEQKDLLQVMPWPVYAKMTNRDLRAIYEFLRAIPSRPSEP
jgi:hypothetical protein